jgi:hypothetical protein
VPNAILTPAWYAAAGHNLDEVGAAFVVIADRRRDLQRTVHNRARQPQGIEGKVGIERVGGVAMAAGGAERLERNPHPRAGHHAGIYGMLQRQVHSIGGADAAHGSESFLENLARGDGGAQHGIEVGTRPSWRSVPSSNERLVLYHRPKAQKRRVETRRGTQECVRHAFSYTRWSRRSSRTYSSFRCAS